MRPVAQPYPVCGTLLLVLIDWQPGKRAKAGSGELRLGGRRASRMIPGAEAVKLNQTHHGNTTQSGLQPSGSLVPTLAFLLFPEHTKPDPTSLSLHWPLSSPDNPGFTSFLPSSLSQTLPWQGLPPPPPLWIAVTYTHTHQNIQSPLPALFFSSSNISLYYLFNKNVSLMGRTFSSLIFLRHLDQCLDHK